MGQVIYKYPLRLNSVNVASIPQGARVLTVQTQNETPCLWALVDPNKILEERIFEIFATGSMLPLSGNWNYISTFQLENGVYVFHCFEMVQ